MLSLIDRSVGHSRTVLATLVFILIAGSLAYRDIPRESQPDINIPIIYVTVTHDGISPEDSERLIIRPLEQELRVIEGIKEMRSTGYEGGGNVLLEFEAGFDADTALQDVRDKVDAAKGNFPAATEDPEVHEVNFSLFPVLVVILAGNVPERALYHLARELKDDIESIPSVLEAVITGDRKEMVEVLIDPVELQSYGLDPAVAAGTVKGSNLLVAAGIQDTGRGRFSVKVPGLFESVKDIIELPVKADGDAVVRVGNIAEVRRTFKDPTSLARVNGSSAVALEVSKRSGENVIETIESVRSIVKEESALWPETLRQAVTVSYSQDRSDHIRTLLNDLQNSVMSAVLLVMIVVIAALGIRSAGLVGIAIPGSFLTALLVLYLLGVSLNMVVLFSLILAVGMLVDGAIVVTEYADRRMSDGSPPRLAYTAASRRMAWPIIASTATTLAAFLPLTFWPGVVGEFMKYLPLTVLITLSASLLMALIFVPTLGTLVGRPGNTSPAAIRVIKAGERGELDSIPGFTGSYVKVLRAALSHPAKVLAASLGLLVGAQVLYGTFGSGIEFFPEVEPDNAKIQVRARGNLSLDEQDALMREVEGRVLDISGVETFYTRVGPNANSEESEDIVGSISMEFSDWRSRPKVEQIFTTIRAQIADLAGVIIDLRKEEGGPPVGKPIQLQLASRHPDLLAPAAARVRAQLDTMRGLHSIEDSRPLPGIDWQVIVDRSQAAKYGADIGSVGNMVQMTTMGYKIGTYRPDDSDDEIEIRARFPEKHRTIEELNHVRLNTAAGSVPISNFVVRQAQKKTGMVKRVDGRRVITVRADVDEGLLVDDKIKEIVEWLKTAEIDPRIQVVFKGEDEEQAKAQAFLSKAFLVALFVMAAILVTQFNSFYSAFLILFAVVMSTIGVLIGLLITGSPFGIVMNGIGVIALAGIVVNNNIVLIDTHDRLRESLPDPLEAILRTGVQRLRPVLLTSVTTILGLMPMVLGINFDFLTREITYGAPSTQWWRQLSTSIVFGLGFATVLTLLVTPSALMLKANIHSWREKRREQKTVAVSSHA
ncbi:MAG: efflux RND transporter permease subunit [Arenicellales bacterium]|jgi:multidrug efflux pump|nr:efflux RND transporter permease subunit [Arenicellales bacterium]MDP6313520.1 efflux RND transporter permease subunit [Arenicellales bacterium]MDP7120174.1 efflux RND transporter permease subunit [Arenicellales bacterium]MDP7192317.1 efflux RND transporter permease subunit [Arenicellales bacterium]MDP7489234.1 efflux RND transporter permease subunit [Arenicellales bacterium]